jgi:hypothetical protein
MEQGDDNNGQSLFHRRLDRFSGLTGFGRWIVVKTKVVVEFEKELATTGN